MIAACHVDLEIVPDGMGDRARFTLTDVSLNLLQGGGETAGPDALSFNLPFELDEEQINVLAPSTFKELRSGTTPGDIFGEFAWEVRRREHDATPFVFEIQIPGVDLTVGDFGPNPQGIRFVSRINGIFFGGEDENRGFSQCP